MSLERMICDSCGAPLDVPESARYVTCRHCQTHLRVRRDESVHYTEQLEQIEQHTRKISERLDNVSAYQKVEALDREWMIQREGYKTYSKNGSQIPSTFGAVVGGIAITIFGLFWMMNASRHSSGMAFFGVLIIGAGVVMSVYQFASAIRYQEAESRYQQRRARLLDQANESLDLRNID